MERLLASRAEVTSVVTLGREGAEVRTLTGSAVDAAVDALAGEVNSLVPICEAAGMVAFRRADRIDFFLFEGESVQSALSAMAGR